jgi:hypothetical protein
VIALGCGDNAEGPQAIPIPSRFAARGLDFDVPAEIPAGRTKIELKFMPGASTRFPLKREADEKKRRLARFCGIWTSGDLVEFDAVTKEFENVDESDWQ